MSVLLSFFCLSISPKYFEFFMFVDIIVAILSKRRQHGLSTSHRTPTQGQTQKFNHYRNIETKFDFFLNLKVRISALQGKALIVPYKDLVDNFEFPCKFA